MRPVLRVLSRANAGSASRASVPSRRSYASSTSRRFVTDSICLRCPVSRQHRAYSTGNRKPGPPISDHVQPGPNNGGAIQDAQRPSSQSPHSTRSGAQSEPLSSSEAHGALDSLPDLPSAAEGRRTQTSKRFTHLMDNFQSNIFIASQRLNDLTGYSGIEALKASIEAQEALAAQTRAGVRAAKDAYTTAIAQRSASQREVNELLQRKHAWTSADLERFTALYRSDHANEQAEQAASDDLASAESQAEETASRLSKSILARYHEEQIWSDKIRRMSTWGTWGLMGVNILLFVVFQVAVEPWRRKRLVSGFEEKVREALESEKSGASAVVLDGDGIDTAGAESFGSKMDIPRAVEHPPSNTHPLPLDLSASQVSPPSTSQTLSTPLDRLRASVTDLVSDRTVTLRKLDLTAAVVEGAAAGAAVVGVACWVVLLRRG